MYCLPLHLYAPFAYATACVRLWPIETAVRTAVSVRLCSLAEPHLWACALWLPALCVLKLINYCFFGRAVGAHAHGSLRESLHQLRWLPPVALCSSKSKKSSSWAALVAYATVTTVKEHRSESLSVCMCSSCDSMFARGHAGSSLALMVVQTIGSEARSH